MKAREQLVNFFGHIEGINGASYVRSISCWQYYSHTVYIHSFYCDDMIGYLREIIRHD